MEDFYSAYTQANLLYGLEMSPEDFEEIGLIAWNRIGNKQTRLYRYSIDVDCSTKAVTLPCNCDEIEAVTLPYEDWNYVTNMTANGDYDSQFTENYIEIRKHEQDPFYIHGRYVKYERVGDTLYLDKDCGLINILYKGVEMDEDGLPLLNNKEVDAIACFCAFVVLYKRALASNNSALLQQAQLLEARWTKMCDAARVAPSMSQNDFNRILDAKSSWNRKIFNKSYKPLK